MPEDLKKLSFAEVEKDILKAVAKRRLKKLRDAFEGVDELDADLVDQLIPILAVPMEKIYRGQLYTDLDKSFAKGIMNGSREISARAAEANKLQASFYGENGDTLTQYRNIDLDRIKAIHAGSEPDFNLIHALVEKRAGVLEEQYSQLLREQLPLVFGEKSVLTTVAGSETSERSQAAKS